MRSNSHSDSEVQVRVPRLPREICTSRVHIKCRACLEICTRVHKVLCMTRNLHFESSQSAVPVTKSALRGSQSAATKAPRNVHFEVYKMLCPPRNLHFEVHKVPRLPRNLHFEVHKVLCLRGSQSAVHDTKSALRGSQSAMCLSRNLHFEVHSLPRKLHEMCTSRFTKCCACHEICKRATCPKVYDSLYTVPVTKSERSSGVTDHMQSAAPAMKFYTSEQSSSDPLAPVRKSRRWNTLDHQT